MRGLADGDTGDTGSGATPHLAPPAGLAPKAPSQGGFPSFPESCSPAFGLGAGSCSPAHRGAGAAISIAPIPGTVPRSRRGSVTHLRPRSPSKLPPSWVDGSWREVAPRAGPGLFMVTLSPPEGPQTAAVAVPAAVQPATESVPPARPGTGTGTRQGTSDSAVPHDRVLGFLTQRGQGLVAAGPHHVLGHVAGTGALGTATPGAVPGPCRAAALCAVPCALQALPSCAVLCHPVLCHVPSCATCLIPCPAGATLSAMPCHAVPHVPPCCHPISCHTMCHTVPCHFPCCHVVLPSHAVCPTVLSSHPNLSHPLSHTVLSSRAMCLPVLSSRAMCHPVLSSHPMPCPTLCCHPMLCHVPQCATIPCHAPPHATSHIVPMLCSFPPALSPTLSPRASCGPTFLSGYC